jgi:porin
VEKLEQRYEGIGKYAIGYWAYSKDFEDLLDNDANGNPLRSGNRGIYVLMENTLYRSKDSASEVAAFLRHGRAEKDVNIFDASTSVGVRVRGLISGRVDDFFGLAVTRSDVSEKFRLAQETAGTAVPDHETAVELTYRAQIEPWLVIQPTVQRIFNPGLTPDVKNATVIGVRCEISL